MNVHEFLSNSMKLVTILTIKKQIRNGLTFESCDSFWINFLPLIRKLFFPLYFIHSHSQDPRRGKPVRANKFIVEKQQDFPPCNWRRLAALLSGQPLSFGAKIIHRDINKEAGLVDILGTNGVSNVQGEAQMKLDLYANEKLKAALKSSW